MHAVPGSSSVARGLAACLVILGLSSAARAAPRKPPNILFILADDLGYGDLGAYGQKRIATPNLDRMAAQGTRFTQVYAGSTVCAPSRSVLMTGLHTGHTRIRGNGRVALQPGDVTVAEVLKTKGYRTGLVGKWGLGHEDTTGAPGKQGFDEFFGYLDQGHAHNSYPTYLWRNGEKVKLKNVVPNEAKSGAGVATEKVDFSNELFTQEALSFIDRHKSGPFFLYLALTSPHANNEGGKLGIEVPDLGQYKDKDWPEVEKRFAALVTWTDAAVGRVLDRLEALGLDEQTIVFFTSDNGAHHEGGHDADFFDSNGPLRGTKRSLTEGGIRVPMIVRWSGHVPSGRVCDSIGHFADFLPTAAALAGVKAPKGLDGVDGTAALLDTKGQANDRFLYWEFHEKAFVQAVRWRNWKAIRTGLDGKLALYDVGKDIGEEQDLAAQNPDVVAKVQAYLKTARVESKEWPIK